MVNRFSLNEKLPLFIFPVFGHLEKITSRLFVTKKKKRGGFRGVKFHTRVFAAENE